MKNHSKLMGRRVAVLAVAASILLSSFGSVFYAAESAQPETATAETAVGAPSPAPETEPSATPDASALPDATATADPSTSPEATATASAQPSETPTASVSPDPSAEPEAQERTVQVRLTVQSMNEDGEYETASDWDAEGAFFAVLMDAEENAVSPVAALQVTAGEAEATLTGRAGSEVRLLTLNDDRSFAEEYDPETYTVYEDGDVAFDLYDVTIDEDGDEAAITLTPGYVQLLAEGEGITFSLTGDTDPGLYAFVTGPGNDRIAVALTPNEAVTVTEIYDQNGQNLHTLQNGSYQIVYAGEKENGKEITATTRYDQNDFVTYSNGDIIDGSCRLSGLTGSVDYDGSREEIALQLTGLGSTAYSFDDISRELGVALNFGAFANTFNQGADIEATVAANTASGLSDYGLSANNYKAVNNSITATKAYTDKNGGPKANESVTLRLYYTVGGKTSLFGQQTVTTGADGTASCTFDKLPAGDYTLYEVIEGQEVKSDSVVTKSDDTKVTVTYTDRTATIQNTGFANYNYINNVSGDLGNGLHSEGVLVLGASYEAFQNWNPNGKTHIVQAGSEGYPVIDFGSALSSAADLSASLATAKDSSDVKVYYLTADEIAQKNIKFSTEGREYLLINVDATGKDSVTVGGENFRDGQQMMADFVDKAATKIIYNFYTRTDAGAAAYSGTVSTASTTTGVLLAPRATVNGANGNHGGTIIAETYNHTTGEIHQLRDVPSQTETVSVSNAEGAQATSSPSPSPSASSSPSPSPSASTSPSPSPSASSSPSPSPSASTSPSPSPSASTSPSPSPSASTSPSPSPSASTSPSPSPSASTSPSPSPSASSSPSPSPSASTSPSPSPSASTSPSPSPSPIPVQVSKVTATGGEELPGASLTLTSEDGSFSESWTTGSTAKELTLTPGTYTLTETAAPNGYALADSITFVLREDGVLTDADGEVLSEAHKIEMIDEINLSVSKVDLASGEELPGAELTVTDSDGTVVERWVSDGSVHAFSLPAGSYTLTEISAPGGYELAESIDFVVHSDATVTSDVDGAVTGTTVVMQDARQTAELSLTAQKYFYGSTPLTAGRFAFTLTSAQADGDGWTAWMPAATPADESALMDNGADPIAPQTVTNDGSGKVEFPAIRYDHAGVYHYLISEENTDNGAAPGGALAMDPSRYLVTVTVAVADGALTVSDPEYTWLYEEYSEEAYSAEFYNNEVSLYGRSASFITVSGEKQLLNAAGQTQSLTAGQFRFELADTADFSNIVATAANDENGRFDLLLSMPTGSAARTYYLREQNAGQTIGGVVYSDAVYRVVIENGEVSYPDGAPLFTNTAATQLTVTKVWNDEGHEAARPTSITVNLYADGNTAAPVDSAALSEANDWTHTFTGLNAKTVYSVAEVETPGYESTLTQNQLENGDYSVVITNRYQTDANAVYTPTVRKVLEGRDNEALADGEFHFVLRDESGEAIDAAYNAADGTVTFNALHYTEPGVYTYTIAELAGGDSHIVYDDRTVTLTVTVEEKDGLLTATGAYAGGEGEAFDTFVNTYRSLVLRVRKTSRDGSGDPLVGAVYGLWMVNDNGADAYIGHATSDADGYLTFKQVVPGEKYYFKEESAPSGHTVDEYPSAVFRIALVDGRYTLLYEGDEGFAATAAAYAAAADGETDVLPVVELTAEGVSDEVTKLQVAKLDGTTGEYVTGATLQIIEKSTGKVVYQWVTGESVTDIQRVLNVDTVYILHEAAVPENYTAAADTEFSFDAYGILSIHSGADAEWVSDTALNLYDARIQGVVTETITKTKERVVETVNEIPVVREVVRHLSSPKTGDNAPLLLTALLMAAGVLFIIYLQQRKRYYK